MNFYVEAFICRANLFLVLNILYQQEDLYIS